MKALSIKQYWLYAITDLDKRIENRSRKPPASILGRRIALHASARAEWGSWEQVARVTGIPVPKRVPLGAIVGSAIVTGFVAETGDKWFTGPFGWRLTQVHRLDEPIPMDGMLGLWEVPAGIATEIEHQVKRDGLAMDEELA